MAENVAMAILIPLAFYGGLGLIAYVVGVALRTLRGHRQIGVSDYAFRERLRRLARPTLLLTPTKSRGFSKIGGLPELPENEPWPQGDAGPLSFVAQIDIEAFRPHGGFDWLPETGRIFFFYDDDRNGRADCGHMIYSTAPTGPPQPLPTDLPKNRRFGERSVGFMQFKSLPSADWLSDEGDYSDVNLDAWPEDTDIGDEIEHRIGGYPSEIQNSQMAVECEYLHRGLARDYREPVPDDLRRAARQWRLLRQIDSDPALNMNWWDAGRLYVFIRARDAKRGDFSKTVTITQTH